MDASFHSSHRCQSGCYYSSHGFGLPDTGPKVPCFDGTVYKKRVYYGYGKADASVRLVTGPNIVDWPPMDELHDNILMRFSAVIHDPVTTTDELIPSGDTASYRSNPYPSGRICAVQKGSRLCRVPSVHSGSGRGEKTGKNAGGAGSGDEPIWY